MAYTPYSMCEGSRVKSASRYKNYTINLCSNKQTKMIHTSSSEHFSLASNPNSGSSGHLVLC
ncbi:hypothetical protein E2C01_010475 [Portunus trituberculatus]|uniref:Uncharacterized protein n=1 Tax=Portunus trituberculatus TaxID=210409 RepID=A0A5B7D8R8_PORTR|nr:hypothetical protein [Portunus trituberculatus]